MKLTLTVLLSIFSLVQCSPAPVPVELDARQSFGNCYVSGRGDLNGPGTCRYATSGGCQGVSFTGFCPGLPDNVQCCRDIACYSPYQDLRYNFCRNTYKGCNAAGFVSGKCPGGSDVKCCTT